MLKMKYIPRQPMSGFATKTPAIPIPAAPPNDMNAPRAPFGNARSVAGNHLEMVWVEAGKIPACEIPWAIRPVANSIQPFAFPSRKVAIDHATAKTGRQMRVPNLCTKPPLGIWAKA